MINEKLLNEELDDYKTYQKVTLKPTKFNKNFIFNLFRQYKNWNMTEDSYCCYGEEQCCWNEIYDEGNWGLTIPRIREIILGTIKELRCYLRSRRKLGDRLYMYKDKDRCYIYIYLRDIVKRDYHIWFFNE